MKKGWRKRAAGFVLAAAMVVSQLGVWNYGAGIEVVKAADGDLLTNGDFSENTDGWTLTTDLSGTSSEQLTFGVTSGRTGSGAYIENSGGETDAYLTQTISYLEAGTYTFTAYAMGAGNSGMKTIADNQAIDNWVDTADWVTDASAWTELKYTFTLDEDKTDYVIGLYFWIYGKTAWSCIDDISLVQSDADDSGSSDDASNTEGNYEVVVTPSTTDVKAGDTVTLTAKVTKDGAEITDLQTAGLQLWWWTDTWAEGHTSGLSDASYSNYDNNSGYSLTADVTLPSEGSYYIAAELQNSDGIDITTFTTFTVVAEEIDTSTAVEGELNVTKVSDLADDFIMGMDISSIISEFASGVTYKDYDGNVIDNVTDFCKFLAENGITHIRVRVWNNPYDSNGNGYGGGNNDVNKAKTIADACRAAGIKMLVDFHCSDLWTDPDKQQAPKAWENYTVDDKASALKQFLTDSLNMIDPSKDTVAMVQVGNETTTAFIGESDPVNMCTLFSAGAEGVRAYNESVKVVIHLTNPEAGNFTTWAKRLDDNQVNYDILATSYYPYWHGTLANLKSELFAVKSTYGKDVMVAETSYAYTLEDSDGHNNTVRVGNNDTGGYITEPFTVQGQATSIRNLIAAVSEVGGLGVFYWEPAWLTVGDTTGLTGDAYDAQVAANKEKWEQYGSGWASSYAAEYDPDDAGKWYGGTAVDNEAMFYPDGTPTAGLRVWNYVKTGAYSNEVSIDALGTTDQLNVTIKIGESHSLPQTVTVAYTNGSVEEPVTWNASDVSALKIDQTGTYQVSGTVAFSKEITQGTYAGKTSADVVYTLTVLPANLITDNDDAEFNSGENFTADGAALKSIPSTENPYSGSYCMSWWSETATTATVTYNKEIILDKGSYVFEATAQGSEGEKVTLEILDTDGNTLYAGTPAVLAGWVNWQTPSVAFTLSEQTTVKLRVSLEIADDGWGSVDCLYLYSKTTSSGSSGSSSSGGSSSSAGGSSAADTANNTVVTVNEDGTTTETTTETVTNEAGNEMEVTTVVDKDADGVITGSKVVSVIPEAAENTSAIVTVTKDAQENVTDASAEVTTVRTGKTAGVVGAISGDVVSQITATAGVDAVEITVNVTGVKGKTKYTVTVDSTDLTAGNELKVVAIDPETGEYILVNAETYTVSQEGGVEVSLHSGKDYELVTAAEAAAIEKAILKTVKVKKASATVKPGKSTTIKLDSALNMNNVKKITYTSGKKSVATVNKNGKITAKKSGTVTIKAKVTLNNGKTKTVTMKIKVKK